ncbi:hypothetical protein KI387_027038, partial [Taxus chinensis]
LSEFSDVVDIGIVEIDGEIGTIGLFDVVRNVVIGVLNIDVDKGLDMTRWGRIDVDEVVGIFKVDVDE